MNNSQFQKSLLVEALDNPNQFLQRISVTNNTQKSEIKKVLADNILIKNLLSNNRLEPYFTIKQRNLKFPFPIFLYQFSTSKSMALKILQKLLERKLISVSLLNKKNNKGNLAMLATENCDLEMIKFLAKNKADLLYGTSKKRGLLYIAESKGCQDVINFLKKLGIGHNYKNSKGMVSTVPLRSYNVIKNFENGPYNVTPRIKNINNNKKKNKIEKKLTKSMRKFIADYPVSWHDLMDRRVFDDTMEQLERGLINRGYKFTNKDGRHFIFRHFLKDWVGPRLSHNFKKGSNYPNISKLSLSGKNFSLNNQNYWRHNNTGMYIEELPINKVIRKHNKKINTNNYNNTNNNNNIPTFKTTLGGNSNKYVTLKNIGRRKIRYQKNGKAYVIVNKKKIKL